MPRLREADAERRLANGGPNYVEALARGLSVINAFGQERRQLSLSDVARATSLPKASVRRMLHTLITLRLAALESQATLASRAGYITTLSCALGSFRQPMKTAGSLPRFTATCGTFAGMNR